MSIPSLILVALGGAIGSILRYVINLAAAPLSTRLPAATLIANAFGCFAAGILLFFVMSRGLPSPQVRLFLATGILGGLTTFSAFGFETMQLLQSGDARTAFVNIVANVGLSLGAVWLGFAFARVAA